MSQPNSALSSPIKWRTILGLLFVYLATWLDWQWAWGLLFLLWVIPDLLRGVTYFMEPIHREQHPVLYWLILISWILMSIYIFGSLFFPALDF